jgi:hypothetical protein
MPSAGFEPATPPSKRPQTYALDRAVTEVGLFQLEVAYSEYECATNACGNYMYSDKDYTSPIEICT